MNVSFSETKSNQKYVQFISFFVYEREKKQKIQKN